MIIIKSRKIPIILFFLLILCFNLVLCDRLTNVSIPNDNETVSLTINESHVIKQESKENTSTSVLLSFNGRGGQFLHKEECYRDEDCDDPREICYDRSCICKEYYEHSFDGRCVPCPGEDELCNECCSHGSLYCYHGVCRCFDDSCRVTSGVFVTASQIALSAAFIMGLAAIIMVIYRLCVRRRVLTARQRTAQRSAESVTHGNTSFLRASLTSMQIRVLSRLRDRPPTYETQSRVRQETVTQDVPPTIEAPPPYSETRASAPHQPPPYSEIILVPGEYINDAYVDTENVVHSDVLRNGTAPKTITRTLISDQAK